MLERDFKVDEESFLEADKNFYDEETGKLLYRELVYKNKEYKELKKKFYKDRFVDVDDYTLRVIYNV